MNYLIKLILICSILFTLGCQPSCIDGKDHTWNKWSNNWEKVNYYGFMQQSRTCKICNIIETRPSH